MAAPCYVTGSICKVGVHSKCERQCVRYVNHIGIPTLHTGLCHDEVMVDHGAELHDAAQNYRRARQHAEQVIVPARAELTNAIRAAYTDGMRKADILRAIDHVWSRQWLDETVRGLQRER